ncbi:uncharacterized protein LOC120662809 [Panicum virgatum]|uniref:uncharacterized protein LOC120662809 n=1 Tax=Panicum virgatum TaxID=38727 RepID=UPI0019D6980C|nr:uncharacterized protein LOC120662809 [Panicum virgatum]
MRLSKVLMDGGSSLNILYVDTLDAMGIPRACLRESLFPFYGIMPGMKAYPVGNIDLPVMFGSKANFRTKTLTFEVVEWKGVYHAILGRPAYAKFMAVPNYTYLKLKLPGPNSVITVSGSFEQAYISSREYYDLATTTANSAELGQLRAATAECRPDPSRPSQALAFVSTDETKTVVVDDADPTKTVRIGSQLPAK